MELLLFFAYEKLVIPSRINTKVDQLNMEFFFSWHNRMIVRKVAAFKCKMNAFTRFIIWVFENSVLTNVNSSHYKPVFLAFFRGFFYKLKNQKTISPSLKVKQEKKMPKTQH